MDANPEGGVGSNAKARNQEQKAAGQRGLGTCTAFDASCYALDVKDNVIPFVDAHFNVSQNPDDRAFAGLSLGGLMANYLLFNDTTLFGYYGSWSIAALGAPATTSSLWQNPDAAHPARNPIGRRRVRRAHGAGYQQLRGDLRDQRYPGYDRPGH